MSTRHERRLKRKRFEEMLAWPVLILVLAVGWYVGSAVWDGLREAVPTLGDLRAIQDKVRSQ
ncbi:MAG: hypothetical protein ACRCXM_00240 [Beijerinckiaceae bacterium]